MAAQFPHVLHVAVACVSAVHRDVSVKDVRPLPSGHRIGVPRDLVAVREVTPEEREMVPARVGRFGERIGAFRGIRSGKQVGDRVALADAGKEARGGLAAFCDQACPPVPAAKTRHERATQPV